MKVGIMFQSLIFSLRVFKDIRIILDEYKEKNFTVRYYCEEK